MKNKHRVLNKIRIATRRKWFFFTEKRYWYDSREVTKDFVDGIKWAVDKSGSGILGHDYNGNAMYEAGAMCALSDRYQ